MITFNNKTTLNSQPDIANENKVTASDMNEIKSVYNMARMRGLYFRKICFNKKLWISSGSEESSDK